MRRAVIAVLVAAASLTAVAPTGGEATVTRVPAGGGISLRLPHGWHLVRRVGRYQPAVVGSFTVAFARHPCPCARPNLRNCGEWCEEPDIRDFPRAGALLFIWEYPPPQNAAEVRRIPRRPARFLVEQDNPSFAKALARELRRRRDTAGEACAGAPSWVRDFRYAGRLFQLEAYLGPAAGRRVLARVDALLSSLQVGEPTQRAAGNTGSVSTPR
jgi:hypothetical protein